MSFGDFLDSMLEPFAPAMAAKRQAARVGLRSIRQYDAGARNTRRVRDWKRPSSNADREVGQSLRLLRDGSRELVRNNKYASAAVRQMKAQLIGDGITARAVHTDQEIADKAQAEWDRWSASKVYDGRHDFFHVQKIVAGTMIEGGEALQLWMPTGDMPDARIRVLEGDHLDSSKNYPIDSGRIVQGVEFNKAGDRVAYHLFKEHPGDGLFGAAINSSPVPADTVDHIYDELRAGQTRGVPWLSSVALTFRDIDEIEVATMTKKKLEACLALILTPPDNGDESSFKTASGEKPAPATFGEQKNEAWKPGMIWRARPGETVQNPITNQGSSDTVAFIRMQLAGISASLVPYHLMTGDVSQANYSSLRAALLGFWSLLDEWQQQIIIPLCCQSAFDRRMRALYLLSGDVRFLQVKAQWAVPNRGFVDPVKDLMGEILSIRAGLVTMTAALSKRGADIDKHFAEIKKVDELIDKLGLALDIDPRRLTSAGILQAAAGYIAPKGDPQTTKE